MIKLKNPLGEISIANDVIARVAGQAASESYGVADLQNRSYTDALASRIKLLNIERGVRIGVDDGKLVIDLHVAVVYGVNISAVARSVTERVKYSVEKLCGLSVGRVTVYVDNLKID